jgi:phage gp45-like
VNFNRAMSRVAQRASAGTRQAFRAILQRLDATKVFPSAHVKGLAGETLDCELIQQYGIASAPLEGAELVVLPLGGASAHGVIIASLDGRFRIKLLPGEVALHTFEGDHFHFKKGRVIELVTETLLIKASKSVRFETPLTEATGNFQAKGDVSDGARSMQGDRDIYNNHDHPGVEQGPASTGKPSGEQ